jgi:hypothetical protein
LGADYWVYATDLPPDLTPKNRGILSLPANSGITLNVAAIGRIHRGPPFARFLATAATCGDHVSDLWVFVDGRLAWKAVGIRSQSGVQHIEVPIRVTDRFLTLATTAGDARIGRGGAAFGDPMLEPQSIGAEASPAATIVAVAPSTNIVYSEDFESMSAGPLCGQGGWTAGVNPGVINVGSGGRLANMQILAVRTGNGIPDASHPLGPLARLDGSQVTTLQWDTEHSGGRNAAFGFGQVPARDRDYPLGSWDLNGTGWTLDPSHITDVIDDKVNVAGGMGGVVHLRLVVDGPARTMAGYYDFGGGWTQAGRWTITLAQIEAITRLYLVEDYRDWTGGGSGVGVDNISLSTSIMPRPVRVHADER